MYDVENAKNIPQGMAKHEQWLCFKLVDRGGARKGKPPVSPKTGEICAKNDETNLVTLQDALVGCETYDLDGVGFVFTNGFIAIDLDDCFEDNGLLKDVARDIFDHFSSTYVEYSPSGNGLHVFARGKKPNDRTKDPSLGVEVYSGYNFVTVTGDHVDGTGYDVIEMQEEIDWLFDAYLPEVIVSNKVDLEVEHGDRTAQEWLKLGLNKDKRLIELYNNVSHDCDESSMDMALLMKLAYWLNRDADAMRDAFFESSWAKSKDVVHLKKLDRKDYLPNSIDKAICTVKTTAYESEKQFEKRASSFLSVRASAQGKITVEIDSYTDVANAQLMDKIYGDVLRYTKEWGWLFYNGTIWEKDADWRATSCAITIGKAMLKSAREWREAEIEQLKAVDVNPDSPEGKRVLRKVLDLEKHALYTLSARGLDSMIKIAKSELIDSANNYDADAWVLNTPDYVIDLSTGERYPHDARQRCTLSTAISPSKEQPRANMELPERFAKFLIDVFCGDSELIEYVQLQIGAMLVGHVYTENLIIANGTGSNGKSTLFGLLENIFGDYATAIDPELLMSPRPSEQQLGASMLEGKRLAVAQETEAGQKLRTSVVKRLVSTDKIVGKHLYHDPLVFTPSHTLVLSTNHLPQVDASDKGIWRRLVVIPFNATIQGKDVIADYQNVLVRNEATQILDWCIEGAMKYFDINCVLSDKKPKAVKMASMMYKDEEDWFVNFINDNFIDRRDEKTYRNYCVWHKDLYRIYKDWAIHNNERILTNNLLSRRMTSAGFRHDPKRYNKITKKCVKAWLGLEKKETEEGQEGTIKFS